jgi:hypothetical protein
MLQNLSSSVPKQSKKDTEIELVAIKPEKAKASI